MGGGGGESSMYEKSPDRSWYKGNIDLATRPRVNMDNGQVATVRGISIDTDKGSYLIPTVSDDGRIMSNKEAIQQFKNTGKHLGFFKNHEEADAYSIKYHSLMAPTDSEYRSNHAGKMLEDSLNQLFKRYAL